MSSLTEPLFGNLFDARQFLKRHREDRATVMLVKQHHKLARALTPQIHIARPEHLRLVGARVYDPVLRHDDLTSHVLTRLYCAPCRLKDARVPSRRSES